VQDSISPVWKADSSRTRDQRRAFQDELRVAAATRRRGLQHDRLPLRVEPRYLVLAVGEDGHVQRGLNAGADVDRA
jgi:hypothetical protein